MPDDLPDPEPPQDIAIFVPEIPVVEIKPKAPVVQVDHVLKLKTWTGNIWRTDFGLWYDKLYEMHIIYDQSSSTRCVVLYGLG